MKLSRYTNVVVCLASALLASLQPCGALVISWRQKAYEGNYFFQRRAWEKSELSYRESIRLYDPAEEPSLGIDLRMNLVAVLTELNKFDEAKRILRQAGLAVERDYRNTLLEVRYLRRLRDLAVRSGDVESRVRIQPKLFALVWRLFGPESPNTMEEALRSLHDSDSVDRLRSAALLQQLLCHRIRPEYRSLYRDSLETYFRLPFSELFATVSEKDSRLVEVVIEQIGNTPVTVRAKLQFLEKCVTYVSAHKSLDHLEQVLYSTVAGVVGSIEERAAKEDQLAACQLLFSVAYPRVHDLVPSPETLKNLTKCQELLRSSLPASERNSGSLIYTHVLTMLALCFVHTGKLERARDLLEEIPVSKPAKFLAISPICEVRLALACAYKQQKRPIEACHQFYLIYSLCDNLPTNERSKLTKSICCQENDWSKGATGPR